MTSSQPPPLQVDLRIPLGHPLPVLADAAVRCEQAGLSGIGVPDHHHTGRDAYLALAAMASRTSGLTLYPATSNVVTRHPLVMASLANSLDELAPGRAALTVAPGFLSVEKAGRPRARMARLREVVLALRGLLGEGGATLDGHDLQLFHRPAGGSRVLVLASGPQLLELAGEVADGVVMLVGLHPGGVEAAREHVRVGARRAGRDPATLEEILIVPIGLGDREQVRHWPRSDFRPGQHWLRYPSASNLRWLRHSGLDLPDPFAGPGPAGAEYDAALDAALADDDLTDAVLDAYGAFGTPRQCADRLLRARDELGMRHAFLFPAHSWDTTYDLPTDVIDAFADIIGPALRA